eukprot:TRINITY_DN43076_c0_g1_i1.p1 TRINITY_DN43076_c0_g1~~TRINITY_DN43076_c0_g1_i1.p1  ORF type:complete len:205 (-),score=36.81 TRINITY_DN43076_c0_g1_i1:39-653(-)
MVSTFAFYSLLGLHGVLGGSCDDSSLMQVKLKDGYASEKKSGAPCPDVSNLELEAFCQDLNVDRTDPACTTDYDLELCWAKAEQRCKQESSKCMWMSANPPKFPRDFCVVKKGLGEQPEAADTAKVPPLFYYPREILSREFIYTDVGPENGKAKVNTYRLTVALQENQSMKDLGIDPGLEDYFRIAPGTGKGTLLDCSNSPDAK